MVSRPRKAMIGLNDHLRNHCKYLRSIALMMAKSDDKNITPMNAALPRVASMFCPSTSAIARLSIVSLKVDGSMTLNCCFEIALTAGLKGERENAATKGSKSTRAINILFIRSETFKKLTI